VSFFSESLTSLFPHFFEIFSIAKKGANERGAVFPSYATVLHPQHFHIPEGEEPLNITSCCGRMRRVLPVEQPDSKGMPAAEGAGRFQEFVSPMTREK